jgi:DHA1 family bicyclomycin/chloramphenicol resistance-like MFS transporter
MAGLVLYTITSLTAAFAPNVDALIVIRIFQALGGCAGLVLGRAIIRDTAPPREAARRLALMNLMVTVGPGVAPLIGGALASTLGWRPIFFLLFALGMTNIAFTWRLLPETRAQTSNTGLPTLARNYRRLLGSPAFLGYAVGGGCATTAMYAFIAASPFIFVHQLNRPDYEVGIYLAVLVSGIWLGSVLATRLISRMAIDRLMVRANLLSVLASFSFLAAILSAHLTVTLAVGSMFVFSVGVGMRRRRPSRKP